MSKLKLGMSPELMAQLLRTKPIFKKRTALWFFTNEINSIRLDENKELPQPAENPDEPRRKLKRTEIWDLWNQMRPEAKRRYFNMAEMDEVRFIEQKALWMAEIGSLVAKQGANSKKLAEVLESFQLHSSQPNQLLKYQKNYDSMIQTESTKTLYKELIERVEKINIQESPENLISEVPRDCRPLLKRPRRPPVAYLLYVSENGDRLKEARKEANDGTRYIEFVSRSWLNLSPEEKSIYEQKYRVLLDEYYKAMEKFKAEIAKSGDSNLDQASKERRAFRKSLRKKLREYDIVPVNVRNPFNFFLKDNKGTPLDKLTKVWNELSEEEKSKYKTLSNEDRDRYFKQKEDYVEIKQSLDSLLNKVAKL